MEIDNQPQNQRAPLVSTSFRIGRLLREPPVLGESYQQLAGSGYVRLGGINMGRKLLVVLAVVGSVFSAAGLLLAHHSASNFDTGRVITLQGTVTEFKLLNPHPLLYFNVKDEAGNVEEWFGESGIAPFRWYNRGWPETALKPGDAITITGNPAKDSSRKMLRIHTIIGADGREWTER